MARKTAYVSFLVEFDDEKTAPGLALEREPASVRFPGGLVIGTPQITVHDRAMSGISHDEFVVTLQLIEAMGGGFMRNLGETLARADSANRQRLVELFWNEICNYRP